MDLTSIRKKMEMELSKAIIPPDKTGAFLTAYDGKRVVAVIATKLGGMWEIEGQVSYMPNDKEKVIGEIIIRATW